MPIKTHIRQYQGCNQSGRGPQSTKPRKFRGQCEITQKHAKLGIKYKEQIQQNTLNCAMKEWLCNRPWLEQVMTSLPGSLSV